MIPRIKEFFSSFIEPQVVGKAGVEHALQVATAALLLETMRMDDRVTVEEREAIAAALGREFGLDSGELGRLMDLAEQEARQATDYYQFTSLVNQSCDADQKRRIIENMWRVAMADGHLDAHELHLMRKIADLLHVGHADYVAAKQRAREAAGLSPGR
jgi:uncharacterized tellurite resistance protein B-like protein